MSDSLQDTNVVEDEDDLGSALLDSGEVIEIINGVKTSKGEPTEEHQAILGEVYFQLRDYLRDKVWRAFVSPFSLKVRDYSHIIGFEQDRYYPDIVVMCFDKEGNRFPQLIIEVASPGTFYKDLTEKLDIFWQMGVKEYWSIISETYVLTHVFSNGQCVSKGYVDKSGVLKVPVFSFQGLDIVLDKDVLFRNLKVLDFKEIV